MKLTDIRGQRVEPVKLPADRSPAQRVPSEERERRLMEALASLFNRSPSSSA